MTKYETLKKRGKSSRLNERYGSSEPGEGWVVSVDRCKMRFVDEGGPMPPSKRSIAYSPAQTKIEHLYEAVFLYWVMGVHFFRWQ
jgi:hypothetical protein